MNQKHIIKNILMKSITNKERIFMHAYTYTSIHPCIQIWRSSNMWVVVAWDTELCCTVSLCGKRREITVHFAVPQLCLCCGVFTCKSDVHVITWKLIHQVTTWKGKRSGGQSGFSDSSEAAVLGNAIYLRTWNIFFLYSVVSVS